MAEVGLVQFARTAIGVIKDVVPLYRSKFSKRIFSQPQLLAILCLMRFEDWTFRETEVRLREHSELRDALELHHVPDYTTVYRFLRRVDDALVNLVLSETACRIPRTTGGGHSGTAAKSTVTVDATGLSATSVSTFFVNRKRVTAGKGWSGKPGASGL